jgi:FtsZ-interacting cell division protein ZipA
VDTSTIIWIIVGIIIVIAIIVIIAVLMTSRRRREAHVESERRKAAELRDDANQTDLARREREAEAARAAAAAKQAEADAKQAQLESDRLARESASHQADAQHLRNDVDERLHKADEVDPDVHNDTGRHATGDDTVRDDRDVTARERPIDPATPRRDETGRQI